MAKRKKGKVTWIRKGFTKKKIDRMVKEGKARVRRIDVGRPFYHYINLYYRGSKKNGQLLATTYHMGKTISGRRLKKVI